MKYNFDEYIERRGTYSIKWDGGDLLKQAGLAPNFNSETIPVFTADMDFACPPPIVEALHKTVDNRIFGYTSESCLPHYANAVKHWFKSRFNWQFNSEDILYVNGTVEAVKIAIEAYSKKGEGVIITRPIYGPFTSCIEFLQRKVVNSQLNCENGYYTMNFEDIEQKAKQPENKMFILCSPHNPTGRVWKKEELIRLSDICKANGVLLVSDEVHCDLIRKEHTHYPLLNISEHSDNIVMLTAINKTFNTAGLKCTNAIITDEKLRQTYAKTLNMVMPGPFGIAAVQAGYNECEEWVNQLNEYLDANIDFALDFIAKNMPNVKAYRPEGTYVLWMDMRELNLSDEEIFERIYNKANVILEPGVMFDPENGMGFQRICLSSPRALLKQAFERIKHHLY